MSRKEEEDEKRLYQCSRKYEKMVKQFDELIEMIDTRIRPPKRRKVSSASRGSSSSQASVGEAFAQTVTRFLHELNTIDPSCTPSSDE